MAALIDWVITRIPPWVFIALFSHLIVLGTVAYLILLERKIASWAQDRIGPNRVGPWGLLQPIADGIKFILKEDYRPAGADKYLFTLAPVVMVIVVIISIAVIPWGGIYRSSTAGVDVTKALSSYSQETIDHANSVTPLPQLTHDQRDQVEAMLPKPLIPSGRHNVDIDRGTLVRTPDGRITATVTYDFDFQAAKL